MEQTEYIRIDDEEIKDDAYAFLFSVCDAIGFVSEEGYGHIGDVEALRGTEGEPFVSAFLSSRAGESWNVRGTLYRFALTEGVRAFVKERGISPLVIENGILQNPELLCGEKCVYSVCTREGYDHWDEGFRRKLAAVCCAAIEKSRCYAELSEKYGARANVPKQIRMRSRKILSLLPRYIEQDGGAIICQKPNLPAAFSEYRALAEEYLTEDTCAYFRRAKRFLDLHPQGFPHTLEELRRFEKLPKTEENEVVKRVERELFFLSYVEEKNERRQMTRKEQIFKMNLMRTEKS